jgi:group I intron endonuclease
MIAGIIYKATNKINKHCYIGKTTRTFERRKTDHKIKALDYKSNLYFHRAIRKYGFENFEWSILTETDSESKLNVLEKFYIATYKKIAILYNMTDGGDGTVGWEPSIETRNKISKSLTGRKLSEVHKLKIAKIWEGRHHLEESKLKSSISNKGQKRSEETKKNISKNHADFSGKNHPMFGKHWTEEIKEKMSEAKKGEKHPFYGKKRPEHSERMSGEKNPMFGKKHTEETKVKMSEKRKKIFLIEKNHD